MGLQGARTEVSGGRLSRTAVHSSRSTLTLLGPLIVTRILQSLSHRRTHTGSCIRAPGAAAGRGRSLAGLGLGWADAVPQPRRGALLSLQLQGTRSPGDTAAAHIWLGYL